LWQRHLRVPERELANGIVARLFLEVALDRVVAAEQVLQRLPADPTLGFLRAWRDAAASNAPALPAHRGWAHVQIGHLRRAKEVLAPLCAETSADPRSREARGLALQWWAAADLIQSCAAGSSPSDETVARLEEALALGAGLMSLVDEIDPLGYDERLELAAREAVLQAAARLEAKQADPALVVEGLLRAIELGATWKQIHEDPLWKRLHGLPDFEELRREDPEEADDEE